MNRAVRERFQQILAKADADQPASREQIGSCAPAKARKVRRRARRPAATPPPPDLIMREDIPPWTWQQLFNRGLQIRLARRGSISVARIETLHGQHVKRARPLVTALPANGEHARKKALELVQRAWSTLPGVANRRAAVVKAVRELKHVVETYSQDAVYGSEDSAVWLLMRFLGDSATKELVGRLHRGRRRPGHVEQGLKKFREDTVRHPEGGFPDDAAAELVAAACGVGRVGPQRRSTVSLR